MGKVDAAVQDGDDDRLRAGDHIPGVRGGDLGQAPLLGKQRVIGCCEQGRVGGFGQVIRVGAHSTFGSACRLAWTRQDICFFP